MSEGKEAADMHASAAFFGSSDFERDRWGRPLIEQESGSPQAYVRATTMAGTLEDLNGLIAWKQAMTAIGMTRSKSIQASMSFLSYDEDKGKVKQLVEKAFALGGGEDKADIGTAFHSLVEMYHRDIHPQPGVELPENFGESLEAYKSFVADWGMKAVASELTIVEDQNRVAGTADLLVTFDRDMETPFGTITAGDAIIADVKTGSVSDYSGMKMGMQLAAYSHGKPYDAAKGLRLQWPARVATWVGLILKVDLEAHTVEPWWLDLKSAFELIPLAVQVRDARKAGRGFITKAEADERAKPKKKAPAKKKAEPEKADPLPPLEVVNIEDQVKAPEPEPSIEPYSVEDAKAKAAEVKNKGELRDLYKDFEVARRRGQSSAEAVQVIASRAADLP